MKNKTSKFQYFYCVTLYLTNDMNFRGGALESKQLDGGVEIVKGALEQLQ